MFIDFEYDGSYLSDFGFMPCEIDGSTDDAGLIHSISKITFNKVSRNYGKKNDLVSTKYEECVTASFYICKNPCIYNDIEITRDEFQNIIRWLNRHEFLSFRAINDDENYIACYYNASFNIEKKVVGDRLIGLLLNMETDKPFGTASKKVYKWEITLDKNKRQIIDNSDEIGFIYPNIEITCLGNGNLTIQNSLDDYVTVIKNCKNGERININGNIMSIKSSLPSHKIADDFNYEFPKIINTYRNKMNTFTFNLPCSVKIEYEPIIKESI